VWRLILLSLLALANISPSFFSLWRYDGEILRRTKPSQVSLNMPSITALQSAVMEGQVFCLQHEGEQVYIGNCEALTPVKSWQSPAGWQVREAFFSDLNLDGEDELALLVWRTFQPWPVDRFMPHGGRNASFHDADGMSCQLILIGLVNGEFRELWAGSALADPLHSLHAADLDGDGLQELTALEYVYDGDSEDASLTVWSWNGFGFSLEARQEGDFSSLLVLPTDTGNVLLAH
jgi:hypothetical protein